jgi:hypothetical protein
MRSYHAHRAFLLILLCLAFDWATFAEASCLPGMSIGRDAGDLCASYKLSLAPEYVHVFTDELPAQSEAFPPSEMGASYEPPCIQATRRSLPYTRRANRCQG